MDNTILIVVTLCLLALAFDFTNGFHDAANSIATVVATRTLSVRQALLLASICNFGVCFFISFSIAASIGKGIVVPTSIDLYVIAGALLGAIAWNIITWYFGLPTSSSHALIGALIGASICHAGLSILLWEGITKILIFIVASPCIGFILGAGLNTVVRSICPKSSPRQESFFRYAQIASCAFYSMGHGANDAQKTAGIIWLILLSAHMLNASDPIPLWAVYISFIAMGLGTLAGGWRIVQTLGFRLTKLEPKQGAVAEISGGTMLLLSSSLGIPVSTTHTITGSILGVGASQTRPRVSWKTARSIVVAWILTIPASAALGASFDVMLRAVL